MAHLRVFSFKYSTRWQKDYIKRSANRGFINRGFQVGNLCVPLEFIVPTAECVCLIIRSLSLHKHLLPTATYENPTSELIL
jgi:hypothetical protein